MSKDLEFIRKLIIHLLEMVIDVLEKMVPFAQEWELISMFHPGWIKGGGSYRY